MLLNRCFLTFLFFLFGFTLWGQESIHKTYTTSDGLISNTVYDIRQDKNGYVWIATDLGLVRFDGNKFREYQIKGNKSSSVSNILLVNGSTWVQNFNGQYFKTEKDGLIYQPKLSKHSNFNLGHDFNGERIAVLANNRVLIFNPKSKNIITKPIPKTVSISSINSTKQHFLLINFTTGKTLRIYKNGKVTIESRKLPFKNEYLHWVIDAKDEYFVAKTKKKVFCRTSGKTYDFAHLAPNSFVQNACLIAKGKLAIMTTNGVILFDAKTKRFTRIFSNYSCSKLIQDREGNWWIGTLGDGIIFIPHREARVYLEGLEISSFQKIGNYFYLGTKENTIYRFDLKTSRMELVRHKVENHEIKSLFYNTVNNDFLYCSALFQYKMGNEPLKTEAISVNQITQLDNDHYLLCESNNLTIFPIKENDQWISWKKKHDQLNRHRLTLANGNRRFLGAVFYQNKIIAQASDGLWLYDNRRGRKLKIDNKNIDVIHLFKAPIGVIITTGDQGIFLFNNGKIKKLDRLSDLLKKQRLYKTKFFNNKFYVLTYSGTIITDKDGKFIQQVMRSDGYPNVDVIDFEVIKNTIYASSTNGFQIIPIPENNRVSKPTILLDECSVNGQKIEFIQGSRFHPNENTIHFNLSVINYRALGNHEVYYSVNDKRWIPVDDNKLQLNELAPGYYNVKIYAKTERQLNKSEVKSFNFEILAPFYKRWWFTVAVLLIFVYAGYWLFKFRLNQIQQKNQILQEKLNLEKQLHESSLSAIKSQMNPHFLFNALNTIQSFIYTNEKEAASSYLVDFSELTRKVLEMSNQTLVVLSEELEALRLYLKLEKMRFEDDFDYVIDTSELPHETFQIPSMLIQPYVENAIKHGLLHKKGEKLIQLKFSLNHAILNVSIIDNGIGLQASKKINTVRNPKHQSFATDANQKRFELLNKLSEGKIGVEIQELNNDEGFVIGTSVKLSIPVKN